MTAAHLLTMNLGDATEARVYYLPHILADRLGFFAEEGLSVLAQRSAGGGTTVAGGQIPSVLDGSVDLTIGGPMVTMKLAEDGEQLVNFCAAVRSNPWVVLARSPDPDFSLEKLAGKRVYDIAHIGTAGFIFDALVDERGIAAERYDIGRDAGLEAFLESDCPYAIHHLHAAAKMMAAGRVHPVADLATPTGGVPWSAYIARPDVIAAKRPAFDAFSRGIGRALRWLAVAPADEVALTIAPDFPDLERATIATIVAFYRDCHLWPDDHRIPAEDMLRFGALLQASGWLTAPPDPALLTADLLAEGADV